MGDAELEQRRSCLRRRPGRGRAGRRSGRSGRNDRGVSALELAIIAPTLIALMFLGLQGGLYFYGRSAALQAARDGVSQLRFSQSQASCESQQTGLGHQVEQFARNVAGPGLRSVAVRFDCTGYNNNGTGYVTVTVTGQAISVLGISMTVSQTARGQIEQFVGYG